MKDFALGGRSRSRRSNNRNEHHECQQEHGKAYPPLQLLLQKRPSRMTFIIEQKKCQMRLPRQETQAVTSNDQRSFPPSLDCPNCHISLQINGVPHISFQRGRIKQTGLSPARGDGNRRPSSTAASKAAK